MAISNEPDARINAGMQKRAKNLADEDLLIEVMATKGRKLSVKGFNNTSESKQS